MRKTAERHERFDIHVPVHFAVLRQEADAPGALAALERQHIFAIQADATRIGPTQPREAIQQGGLARAVRAEQRGDASALETCGLIS